MRQNEGRTIVVPAEDIRLIADGSQVTAKKKDRSSTENGNHTQDKFNGLIFTHRVQVCNKKI